MVVSVSEWGGDSGTRVPGADVDASGSAAGDPEQSATASGNDGSGDLSASPAWTAVQALATLLEPEAFDPNVKAAPEWRERAKGTALAYAAKVITSGYRLVSEDEATVELLAVAMHTAGCGCGMTLDEHQASMRHDFDEEDPAYADMARAAVRALREAGQ